MLSTRSVVLFVSYSASTNRTEKLKLMREDGDFTYNSTPPSRVALVGRKCGIGVDCNLF
jgi:hypothetical protein